MVASAVVSCLVFADCNGIYDALSWNGSSLSKKFARPWASRHRARPWDGDGLEGSPYLHRLPGRYQQRHRQPGGRQTERVRIPACPGEEEMRLAMRSQPGQGRPAVEGLRARVLAVQITRSLTCGRGTEAAGCRPLIAKWLKFPGRTSAATVTRPCHRN